MESDKSLTVLLSFCHTDDPIKLRNSIRSISKAQDHSPQKIVLVRDGVVGPEINDVIDYWKMRLGDQIVCIELDENVGLAAALNIGLSHCSTTYVARMDSDDLSLPQRFSKQIEFMEMNPEVAVVGCQAVEIDERGKRTIRHLPTCSKDLEKIARWRNPLNHPSVIFRRQIISSIGGYPQLRKCQDYGLWGKLLAEGHQLSNLEYVGLEMSCGGGLAERRGWDYLKFEVLAMVYLKHIGFLTTQQFYRNILMRAFLRLPPSFLRRWIYKISRRPTA